MLLKLSSLLLGVASLFLSGCSSPSETAAPQPMKLFLLVGQSNMAGRGVIEAQDKVPHPRIFVLNQAGQWIPAVDPLHYDKPELAGVGLASTFARVLAEAEPGERIGLVPAAVGGTSLDQWAPGGKLYNDAIQRARLALPSGRFAGILWHQGEADSAHDKVATYRERFTALIASFRRDLNDERIPVLIGGLGHFRPASKQLNALLPTLPATIPHSAFVSSDGLNDKGDKTHFDSASLREFGRRYAAAYFELIKQP